VEVLERYGDDGLWLAVDWIFPYMPLGAVVGDGHLCLHGGISPGIHRLADTRDIALPIADCDDPKVAAILWSDPGEGVQSFQPSLRGIGVMFGAATITQFLAANSLGTLVRAHQCVMHGTSLFAHKKCVTVFSSSNYAGQNSAAFLQIHPSRGIYQHILVSMTFVKRAAAKFATPEERRLPRPRTEAHAAAVPEGRARVAALDEAAPVLHAPPEG
jgi:diadenosine tetraphosphatase ApaH/serine/threonine PP2A family protein phosphatase